MSSRRSSGNVVACIGTSALLPATSRAYFVVRARSRRMRSVARFRAVVISQACGLLGTPSRGHRSAAIVNASCAEADQGGQNAAPFLAEDPFERGYQYTSEGRISTAPP
jgi:hypothetical protein